LPADFSVRIKIVGIVLALTMILGLGITWHVRDTMSSLPESELASRGEAVAIEVTNGVTEMVAARGIAAAADVLAAADSHIVVGSRVDRAQLVVCPLLSIHP
jgi:hypothetical protein